MNNSINTATALNTTTAANGSRQTGSAPEDGFGPVMRQQSDLQANASSRPAMHEQKSSQKSDANTANGPARPQADDNHANANDAPVSDTTKSNDQSGIKPDNREAQPATAENQRADLSESADVLASTATLAEGAIAEPPTQQGKNLPDSGNDLPLSDTPDANTDSEAARLLAENNRDRDIDGLNPVLGQGKSDPSKIGNDDLKTAPTLADSRHRVRDTHATQHEFQSDTESATDTMRNSNGSNSGFLIDPQSMQADNAEPLNISLTTLTANTDSGSGLSNSALSALTGMDKLSSARPAASSAITTSAQFQIDAQVNSPDWSNQIGDRIRWMSKADVSLAELKLNPAELGSIEVKIVTEDQQTRVSFITSNAATKEMLESTLPRLREMLLGSGLQLEQSDISHRNDSNTGNEQRTAADRSAFDEAEAPSSQMLARPRADLGQIDHYV